MVVESGRRVEGPHCSLALDLLRTYGRMQVKLASQTIRVLRPAVKPYEIVDAEIKGLLLCVQPSAVMCYYFSYRNGKGKRARYRIGKHGSISPAQARDEALGLSALKRAGT